MHRYKTQISKKVSFYNIRKFADVNIFCPIFAVNGTFEKCLRLNFARIQILTISWLKRQKRKTHCNVDLLLSNLYLIGVYSVKAHLIKYIFDKVPNLNWFTSEDLWNLNNLVTRVSVDIL